MAIACGDEAESCSSQVLVASREVCSRDEVEQGSLVLETFVKAIASSVKQHTVKESFGKTQFSGRGGKYPSLLLQWVKLLRLNWKP
jgi:hypothetical protein